MATVRRSAASHSSRTTSVFSKKLAFEPDLNGQTFNIGPDEEFVSINELARCIADLLEFDLQPVYMKGRPQEVYLANCSADKIRERFDYTNQVHAPGGT